MKLIVMCGPPGSGKSTYAATTGLKVFSADSIRDGVNPARAFAALYAQLDAALAQGIDCVADTCALQSNDRLRLLRSGRAVGARCELHWMTTPVHVCRTRNAVRSKPANVSWSSVAARLKAAEIGARREGWDAIRRVPGA